MRYLVYLLLSYPTEATQRRKVCCDLRQRVQFIMVRRTWLVEVGVSAQNFHPFHQEAARQEDTPCHIPHTYLYTSQLALFSKIPKPPMATGQLWTRDISYPAPNTCEQKPCPCAPKASVSVRMPLPLWHQLASSDSVPRTVNHSFPYVFLIQQGQPAQASPSSIKQPGNNERKRKEPREKDKEKEKEKNSCVILQGMLASVGTTYADGGTEDLVPTVCA